MNQWNSKYDTETNSHATHLDAKFMYFVYFHDWLCKFTVNPYYEI